MTRGTIYKRCRCGRKFRDDRCSQCQSDQFSWAYTVDVGTVGGKRRQRTRSGFTTKKEAVTALNELQGKVSRGTYAEPSKVTVAEFINGEWLPAIESTVRHSTLESYRANLRLHVIPSLGTKRLQELSPADVNALYARLLKRGRADDKGGLSPRTVRYVHTVLHRCLRDAVRWNRLALNPADAATPPKPSTSAPREMSTWTADDMRAFLTHVEDDRLFAAWLLLATTGMRRGEVLGLRWEDVDLGNARVSVQRSLISVSYEVRVSEPKTKRGRRQIALDATTVTALAGHRRRQVEDRLAWGPAWTDTSLVFTRPDGNHLHPDRFSKVFNAHVRAAGLPRIRLHDLRHTYATLALQAGVHPKVISERLGHSSVTITLTRTLTRFRRCRRRRRSRSRR